jgi:HD domain
VSESLQKLAHTFGALADLGQEISESSDLRIMSKTSLHLVQGSLAIMRGALAEYEAGLGRLQFLACHSVGIDDEASLPISFETASFYGSAGIRTVNVDIEGFDATMCPGIEKELVEKLRISLLIPLTIRGMFLGMLFLGAKATGEPYSDDENELLCAMARHIAVGLQEHRHREELERKAQENRILYDGMRAIYKDTVRAFAAAIDCKDKYTQGHSERVGRYSEIIARQMGWSEEEVEGISIAGYLHDIGKLVVDRDIINAPYRIDAKQSSELNKHPAAGYEILSPIRHPYADIPLMARHHHERLDGSGYPDGLTADQIPIGVKIVTLADSFDAMTTDRPYRRRRSLDVVIEDLRQNTGRQFDRKVVIALCRALLNEINGATRERRMIKMLGRDYIDGEKVVPMLDALIADLEGATEQSMVLTV